MSQFEEKDYSDSKLDFKTWKKIFKYVFRHKKYLILMAIAITLQTIIELVYPMLNSYMIDTFFEKQDYTYYYWFIAAYVGVAICTGLFVWAFIYFAGRVQELTTYEIRNEAFEKLQKLSFSYYDRTPMGWVMARMTSDARRLASILSWGIIDILWAIFIMIGIVILLFVLNWKLAFVVIAIVPILTLIAIFFRKRILKNYREVRKVNSKITAAYNEGFMGAQTTKSLVLEDNNLREFDLLTTEMRIKSVRAALFSSLFWPTILVIGYISVIATFNVGGYMHLKDAITYGTLYLFIDLAIRFFDPVMAFARILSDFQQAQASAERIITLIETEPDIVDTEEVIKIYGTEFEPLKENWEKLNGEIEFKDVSFSYQNTDFNVLTDFNLHIKSGQSVAFVGETGSGKSTIINLICRFYEPTSGSILIDGKDYRERSISWLHSNIGYVLQTPHLFSGTIMDNIRYGKLDATDEEVIEVAKLIKAHDFISKLENGYYTDVGEGGNKLSTGEKQLISFARAIISDPTILVLDEATSSIDTENEKNIQSAMNTVLKGRTSLIVAHRLSTIVNADVIVVLKDGKILEKGTHKELLNKKGYYFELYRTQFIQELEEKLSSTI
jgi:ATP-binding cassette subfamily B protein